MKKSLTVGKIDNEGIFVGERNLKVSGESKLDKMNKEIDDSWGNIRLGNQYSKEGQYEKAAEAFSKAYLPRHGEKALAGFKLAETYEKLNRYDDAIIQLKQMIQNRELSELGIQDAKGMISRLLAAKAAQERQGSGQ